MTSMILRLRHWVWAIMVGTRFQKSLEHNEHAAAELDAVVREVLQK